MTKKEIIDKLTEENIVKTEKLGKHKVEVITPDKKNIKEKVLEELNKLDKGTVEAIRVINSQHDFPNDRTVLDAILEETSKQYEKKIKDTLNNLENPIYECKKCQWKGTIKEMTFDQDAIEWYCPKCNEPMEDVGVHPQYVLALRDVRQSLIKNKG